MNSTADSKSELSQYSLRYFVRIPRDLCQCLGSVMVELESAIISLLLIITYYCKYTTCHAPRAWSAAAPSSDLAARTGHAISFIRY